MIQIKCEGFYQTSQSQQMDCDSIISDQKCQKLSKHMDQARCVLQKSYSLEPDMLGGWIPKIPSIPIPLYYSDNLDKIKAIIRSDSMYKIVYEWKNKKYNSVKLHQSYNYKWQKRQKYQMKLGFLQEAVQKIGKPKQMSFNNLQNWEIYTGQYRFNSDFESGNLELVVRLKPDQYDCYLRSDSNTNGHTNWFWFTVENFERIGPVKINICNLKKTRNLYGKGMQPYLKLHKNQEWSQTLCQQVNFVQRYCRYRPNVKCNHLQFKYTFTGPNQLLNIAYCIPYTYTQLLQFIDSLNQNKNFEYYSLGQSYTGLNIPLLRITNTKKSLQNKKTIVMIGRTHPGESNSSYVIQGILKQLLAQSNSSRFLRDKFQFYIIPMLNVDGVVLGNFRCGGQGVDFNRFFNHQLSQKTVEIKQLIDLISDLKQRNHHIEYVIDFHGHSQQKNCFFYGPQFQSIDKYFLKSRLFAKMFQQKCSSFRFNQSCFHIPQYKRNTARSYMNSVEKIPMVFTLQVSNGVYQIGKNQKFYNRREFQVIGKQLLITICDFEKTQQMIERNLKLIEMKKMSNYSMQKKRSSLNYFGIQEDHLNNKHQVNRNSKKRSSMKLNRSVQNNCDKLLKKRSSQNLQKIYVDKVGIKGQSHGILLVEQKIKIMIQDICKDKQKLKRNHNNLQSDVESQQQDFDQVQRCVFDSEIKQWSRGFIRKNISKSQIKENCNQKVKQVLNPKINNLFEIYNKQSILKNKRQSSKNDMGKNLLNNNNGNRINIVKRRIQYSNNFNVKNNNVNRLNRSQLIDKRNKNILSQMDYLGKQLIKNKYEFGIQQQKSEYQQQQMSRIKRQKQFILVNTMLQNKLNNKLNNNQNNNKLNNNQNNNNINNNNINNNVNNNNKYKKQNICGVRLGQNNNVNQQSKRIVKNSLWNNNNIKNILRSNRFPFVMEKFL